ncbi:MAG: phage tail protein [Planctomycetota bacterium]
MSKLDKNRASHFKVTINSIEVADFSGARGLDLRTEVLEYREGGMNERTHKIPGETRFTRIVLEHGSSASLDLFKWVQDAINGKPQRKDGAIIALNQEGKAVARYEFREAWPCGYEGPSFAGARTEVAIERLTIAHKGFSLEPGDVKQEHEPPQVARQSEGGPQRRSRHGPAKHDHDHVEYPPRSKAAQEECKKVCAVADKTPGCGKSSVPVIAVFTEEDEQGNPLVVHVGLSGGVDANGEPTPKGQARAQALQDNLNEGNQPPPTYVVSSQPVDFPGYTNTQGDPAPGNCAEPKAANGVPGGAGNADGFDVRYRGKESDWEGKDGKAGLKDQYEYKGEDKDPDPPPQMNPCNTCSDPHNKAGILGSGG